MPDRSALPPEKQTTKLKTKTCPCKLCGRPLIVNTFYAPDKARCSDCRGAGATASGPSAAIRAAVGGPVPEDVVVEPNYALRDLRCMFDGNPMVVIRVNESMGWITFQCQHCQTAVELMPNWSPMVIPHVPEALKPIVAEFNDDQMAMAQYLVSSGQIDRRGGIGAALRYAGLANVSPAELAA